MSARLVGDKVLFLLAISRFPPAVQITASNAGQESVYIPTVFSRSDCGARQELAPSHAEPPPPDPASRHVG